MRGKKFGENILGKKIVGKKISGKQFEGNKLGQKIGGGEIYFG